MTETATNQYDIYRNPVHLLQELIRFDTSNPPGNEKDCIDYINYLLNSAGIETIILARDPSRPNLIARISGQGSAAPLLLFGHVDVVPVENQEWTYPPFEGIIANDYLWGRGTLDMKGGVAMMLAAFLRAKLENNPPAGDVILTIVSDEEKGGEYGAKFLVKNHSSLFTNVRYAIGEFGGFSFYIGENKFYPIMVSEKQPCLITVRLKGPSGHPTVAFHGGAMAQLGETLHRFEHKHLPVHITPATRMMIQAMSTGLSFPASLVLKQLLNPFLTDRILKLLGKQVEQFEPLLHNTVNATAITGADDSQRIPDDIKLHLICVMLPGFTPDDMIEEFKALIGEDIEVEEVDTSFYEPIPSTPDMGLFNALSGVLLDADPAGIPVPLLLPSPTDGRFFSQLGIQTYGFLPMELPPDFSFWLAMHAADERIPLNAVTFGTDAIYKVIQRFGRD